MPTGRAFHRRVLVPSSFVRPLADAQREVFAAVVPNEVVIVDHRSAAGCVLASDIVSTEAVPPFDNSAVDGYAVQAADVVSPPVSLRVLGEMAAGADHAIAVEPATAVRIMTGAPIPPGCDAVVMVEDTETGDGVVTIRRAVGTGSGIRVAGSDVRAGDLVFRAGAEISGAMMGVLASINSRTVAVHRRPRVAVMSTGDELVDDGSTLRPGQIRESNRSMLVRLVEEAGSEPVDFGIVPDDESVLESTLHSAAATCDAIVTSGGVSMGDRDVVKAVLGRIAEMSWMQIAIKPAKPFAFGRLTSGARAVPVFGLPGNPVSSLVSFELLARPALRLIAGHPMATALRPRVPVVVDHDVLRRPDGKTHFDRVHARWDVDGRLHVSRESAQGSHQLAATASANALLEIADGDGWRAGNLAPAILIGPPAPPRGWA